MPGICYRPSSLKSLTVLYGNTEKRTVFNNFDIQNMNVTYPDYTHELYQRYLENNYFVPPGGENEHMFWDHTRNKLVPNQPYATETKKGFFNIFPLNLAGDELQKAQSSNLGVISTSPLKVEVVCEPVNPNVNWFISFTFVYLNKINFTGHKLRQEVTFDQMR